MLTKYNLNVKALESHSTILTLYKVKKYVREHKYSNQIIHRIMVVRLTIRNNDNIKLMLLIVISVNKDEYF